MYKISLQNEAGELESRKVSSEDKIADALVDFIRSVGSVHAGDRFVVTQVE